MTEDSHVLARLSMGCPQGYFEIDVVVEENTGIPGGWSLAEPQKGRATRCAVD